jgi:2-hydroxycyclohexanecarboxyl-CoA dehydrogenase
MRTALVTGAAGGIGRAIALELAAHNRQVAVADLNKKGAEETVAEISEHGRKAIAIEMDVTDSQSVNLAVEETERELGPVDVLVNNAGWDELRPFIDTDEEFWDRVIEINYKGCLRTTHRVLPAMLANKWGRIVNIGSDAGRVGSSMESIYAGAKGGVIAFTKTLAREYARDGITANTVCPGPTRTPLLEGMAAEGEGKLIESLERAVPMKRLGEPEDVAAAVEFLQSDRASFITGQTLSVSGGLTMA